MNTELMTDEEVKAEHDDLEEKLLKLEAFILDNIEATEDHRAQAATMTDYLRILKSRLGMTEVDIVVEEDTTEKELADLPIGTSIGISESSKRADGEIKGYKVLSDEQKVDMNDTKILGEQIGKHLNYLLDRGADPRWVSIAKTQLQQGLMAVNRGITKPEFF